MGDAKITDDTVDQYIKKFKEEEGRELRVDKNAEVALNYLLGWSIDEYGIKRH